MTQETAIEVLDAEMPAAETGNTDSSELRVDRRKTMPHLWRPGQSGNPAGRPRAVAEVVELARSHTVTAMQTLVEIATNKKASSPARVAAAQTILDRGWGRAAQVIELGATGSFDEWLKARTEAMRDGR